MTAATITSRRCPCPYPTRHYGGAEGAAGLLLVSNGAILLQHRSAFVDHPETWALPGGKRRPRESATAAALREAYIELSAFSSRGVTVQAELPTMYHGLWSYTAVLATTGRRAEYGARTTESTEARWVELDHVTDLPLHPLFALTWPGVRTVAAQAHHEEAPAPRTGPEHRGGRR